MKYTPKPVYLILCPFIFVSLGIGVTIALFGCQHIEGNPLAEPEKFAEVYVDLLVASAEDTLPPASVDSILAVHGFERKQFEDAVQHYGEQPEKWQEVFQKVVADLEERVSPDSSAVKVKELLNRE